MKTIKSFKWITVILLLSFSMQLFAQSTNEDYYKRLSYLCRVWGHAKYFHTEIAKGEINWDNQLLTAISNTKIVASDAEFNAVLLQMLKSAGPMETSTEPLPTIPDEMNINRDHSWIDSPIYSAEVKAILHEIQDKFRPQSNYYVTKLVPSNANFDADNQYYDGYSDPSEGLRLLSLFRFWNIHNYFLPYKNQMVNNLDDLLLEFIPRMIDAEDELEYQLAIKELTCRFIDAHSMFFSPVYTDWVGTSYPPFQVKLVQGQTIVTKVLPEAEDLGISVGDVIEEIDGVDINTLRSDLRKYGYGSNDPAIDYTVTILIMWGDAGIYPLKATNQDKISYTTQFTRNETNNELLLENTTPVWTSRAVEGYTYGIVDMVRLEVADVGLMFSDLQNTDAIIFDIRGYPNNTLWTIVNYLFPGPIHIGDFTCPDVTNPGALYWKNEYIGYGTGTLYKGKVLMIFDERARSLSEYTTMGLEQFPDAIKVGNTTAGADANVAWVYLPGNCRVTMNGLGCFYPDGTQRSRQGIIPDYEVYPTRQGILDGRDELLEFALNPALLNVHPDYCTSYGNATREWIASVSLGSNSNPSGSSATIGYEIFESPIFNLESGKSYPIVLEPGFTKANFEYWAVWIDFDGDQGFDEPGELVFSKNKSRKSVSGTVVIPAGLSISTRMRVSMSNSPVLGPCSIISGGEVEDYNIIISEQTPDPLAADFSASPLLAQAGTPIQFTDQSAGDPTKWNWSFSGGNPSISTSQNPSIVYNLPGIYSVSLMVTNVENETSSSSKTDYITITGENPVEYCFPENISSDQDYIKTVDFPDVYTNTTGASGYSLYQIPTTFTPGNTYPISLSASNSSDRNYWRIWIDFNGDKDFDDSGECVLSANNKRGAFTGSIAIPQEATGSTHMRISMRYKAAPLPCSDDFVGEVEDYEIIIDSPGFKNLDGSYSSGIVQESENNILIYPNPVNQQLYIQIGELSGKNELAVYSIEGKLMQKALITSTLSSIDVSTWTKGVYFIQVNDKKGRVIQKIIIN